VSAGRPERVGFLIDRWGAERGGAEAAMAALAERVAARGAEVIIFAERADEARMPRGARWERVRGPGLTRTRREARLAAALVGASAHAGCDVTIGMRHLALVDLYWPHGGSYRASLAARRESQGRTLEARPGGRHRVFLELEHALLSGRGAKRIVCVSELVREELAREYPACADRLVVVENGVDLERFHPRERSVAGSGLREELELPYGTPLLAFSARDPELKGLPRLLRALEGMREIPWKLLVAGARSPAKWVAAASRRAILPRVTFREHVDPVALAAGADLCVLPTWRDTSSLVVLEALAAGTPVVTTRRAGAADTITSSAVGTVLPDPADVAALQEALRDWLERLAHGPIDRAPIRGAVEHRDRKPWLDALATLVEDLASRV
jgi:UDP-glucose:(heptosyl)LPS alpha-1,3-glucosyltransferase